MKIQIPERIQEKVMLFAKEVTKTTYKNYSKRGQNSYDKIVGDHYRGTLAEFAVWAWLKRQGIILDPPDLTVTYNKSHSEDLKGYHIKSVAPSNFDSGSWVYERNCKYLYSGKHVFCVCNSLYGVAEIKYVIDGKKLEELYKPLRKKELKTKVAIYADDLEKLDDSNFIYKGE